MPVEVAQAVVAHPDGVDDGDAGAALHVAAVFLIDAVLVHHHHVGLGSCWHGCRKVLDAQVGGCRHRLDDFFHRQIQLQRQVAEADVACRPVDTLALQAFHQHHLVDGFDVVFEFLLFLLIIHHVAERASHQSRRHSEDGDAEDAHQTGDDLPCKGNRRHVGEAAGVADILRKSPYH